MQPRTNVLASAPSSTSDTIRAKKTDPEKDAPVVPRPKQSELPRIASRMVVALGPAVVVRC
ncbi:MAG: hypothetical protein J0I07_08030 [Myxococcales bacterium]|nr:hypothetical protein [Myxococcales bacterium]